MWLRFGAIALCILAIGAAAWNIVPWFDIQRWATGGQRVFQNAMAGALRGIRAGDPWAVWTLCSATAAYGFFHALGPGHGKVLIGGAAITSGTTLTRMSILTVLSSLVQAATAILLVGSLFIVVQMRSSELADFTEAWLAAASYAAIAAIGAVLLFRGARSWYKMGHANMTAHSCCGHAHVPSVDDVATLTSTRDAVALITGIAMGLGTAAFNLTVATSGVAARRLAGFGARDQQSLQAVSAALHVTGGILIIAISINMLVPYLD